MVIENKVKGGGNDICTFFMKWNRGSWSVRSNQSVKNQIGHANIYENRNMFPFHYKYSNKFTKYLVWPAE